MTRYFQVGRPARKRASHSGGPGCGSPKGHSECKESIEELYSYLDGELTEDKREVIRNHLDKCQPCLDAFDFEDDLRKLISMKCKDHVPDGLKDRVFQAIEVEMNRSCQDSPES